jgi:hypothetical protein
MHDDLWLVVGDRFWQFAVDRKAITVSYLRGLLNSTRGDDLPAGRMVLKLGQGVSDEDRFELLAMAQQAPHAHRFDFSGWSNLSSRASTQVSHKLRAQNILLSEAIKCEDGTYEMDLMLDDQCELMMDHQTGRHLAGVVLIEAVRQALLVVTEGHVLPRNGKKHDFTFHDLAVKFHRYCFPFETKLRYTIREMDVRGSRYRFVVDVQVYQCGVVVMSAVANMTAHVSSSLSKIESEQATRSLNYYLASLGGTEPAFDETTTSLQVQLTSEGAPVVNQEVLVETP